MTHDIRALANVVLDRADALGVGVSNIHINKALYFLYVWVLLKSGSSLTNAKIEAWDYGPVFREIYQEFKKFGRNSISGRAQKFDASSGLFETPRADLSTEEKEFLFPLIDHYLRRDPFDLVELTHKKGTPWYSVYHHNGRSNPGMRISDDLIFDYYSRQTRQ